MIDHAAVDLAAPLADPSHLFTRDEVALLMGTAFRWGYERRVDEENETWPPRPVFTFGRWYNQALERERADAECRRLVAARRAA